MRKNRTTCVLALSLICSSTAIAQESVMGRLATAKILESKGDVLGAEKELRSALQTAPESEQTAVTAQLIRLLGKQGRSMAAVDEKGRAQPQNPLEDPVDRLIGVLNTGDQTPEVRSAIRQLGQLGDLVVPHLMRAFPKLGPFGVMNTLQVLRYSTDKRIAPFLVKQLETAEPEIKMAIINRLSSLPESSGLPVALKVGQGDFDDKQKLVALSVLLRHAPESTTCQGLAHGLLNRDVINTRMSALLTLLHAEELSEAKAVKALRSLPKRHWPEITKAVRNKKWAVFGQVVLEQAIADGSDSQFELINQFDWRRSADDVAPVLLRSKSHEHTSNGHSLHPAVRAMNTLVRTGWKLPAKLDDEYIALVHRIGTASAAADFVESLPDDEERALALWERHGSNVGYWLVQYGIQNSRQWYRLVTRHLLTLESPTSANPDWFELNWSKAPKEAIDNLIAFAKKWPSVNPGQSSRWAEALIGAYKTYPSLPVDVVRPLFMSGHRNTWTTVAGRDPHEMLVMASDCKKVADPERLARVLGNYGTAEHVPLALRALRVPLTSGNVSGLHGLLDRHGAGHVALITASRFPDGFGKNTKSVRKEAEDAAQTARVADLDELLAAFPSMPGSVVDRAVDALAQRVSGQHVEAVGKALLANLKRNATLTSWRDSSNPIGSATLCELLVELLEATKDPRALPYLEAVLADGRGPKDYQSKAAFACLVVAGERKAELIRKMLQSDKPFVATTVMRDEDIPKDAELLEAAVAALMRLAKTEASTEDLVFNLDKKQAQAVAKKLLEHEDLKAFRGKLVEAAIDSFDGYKDARYVPLLTKATQHPYHRVRERAAQILGNTFVREAADPLLELLKDDASNVRQTAQDSLNQIANYLDERAKWEKRFGK